MSGTGSVATVSGGSETCSSPSDDPDPLSLPSLSERVRPRRHPSWANIPTELWDDWKWQLRYSITSIGQLARLLHFPTAERARLERMEQSFKLTIPPYYFSLIDADDPQDPIRRQSVPSVEEENESALEQEDPLEEDKDCPVPGLTHRYPDRVLVLTTPLCSMYCRFCTRKRVTIARDGWKGPTRDERRMVRYVQEHGEIHDVILSGGDPLMLPPARLRWFLESFAAIPHVDVIRVGSRVPVTLPQRLFDSSLVQLLQSVGKVWIQTHFNHPREVTPESARAVRALVNAGIPVNNHSVLLKGVNDSVEVYRELVRALLRIKVRPYYLFHCDPVIGNGHFRTTIWKGMEIIEGLRGHVSGLAVPTYVVDGLGGAGKIPIMPNYLVSAGEGAVVLRNYEGMLFRYEPEDAVVSRDDKPAQLGVCNLVTGNGRFLLPEGMPRLRRRRAARPKA
ncbi:MAG: KamA family radical SAM protein [Planctomycetes bacterium]|nr:KamA family radical SAM protein [Planctomycetota bacterium]